MTKEFMHIHYHVMFKYCLINTKRSTNKSFQ